MKMPSDLAEKGTRFTLNRYQRFFNKKLTAKKPATFTDKIHHFIIAAHWQDIEIVTKMTDKINVRTYVASQIGLKYLNEVAWTSSKIDNAPLQDYACGNWILKTNHGCGGHHVIKQNRLIEIRQEIKDLLTKNYYFAAAEPQYFFIEPKAFIEKLVKSGHNKPPLMFRLWCFTGSVALIQADDGNPVSPFYNRQWQDMQISRVNGKPPENQIKRPENLNELIQTAEKLSRPFKFVRVDLYSENEDIRFSELTFTPLAGNILFHPKIWDLTLGELWQ